MDMMSGWQRGPEEEEGCRKGLGECMRRSRWASEGRGRVSLCVVRGDACCDSRDGYRYRHSANGRFSRREDRRNDGCRCVGR
jgi:hypothetical protein